MNQSKKLGLLGVFLIVAAVGGFFGRQWWQRRNAPFACPVPKKYCYRGKKTQLRDGSPAIGFQVPTGTRVQAGISGLVGQGAYKRPDGKIEQSMQIEAADGSKLYYAFVGQSFVQTQPVAVGQPLRRVEEEKEAVKGTGANLVVYFRGPDGQIKPLEAKDFR